MSDYEIMKLFTEVGENREKIRILKEFLRKDEGAYGLTFETSNAIRKILGVENLQKEPSNA